MIRLNLLIFRMFARLLISLCTKIPHRMGAWFSWCDNSLGGSLKALLVKRIFGSCSTLLSRTAAVVLAHLRA
jgi:hypothetical protein